MNPEEQKTPALETKAAATAHGLFYISDNAGSFLSVEMVDGHITNYTLGPRAEALSFKSEDEAMKFITDHLLPATQPYVVVPGPFAAESTDQAQAAANIADRQVSTEGKMTRPDQPAATGSQPQAGVARADSSTLTHNK